jgi:uncharacterized membrane protein
VLVVKPTRWLEIILLYTVVTMAVVYLVPSDSPLLSVRYALGFIFVIFLPGYCLVNIFFLGKNRLDPVETAVLSVALSFGITGLVGLLLGLSPITISFESVTVSLTVIVLVLALLAFVRKTREPVVAEAQPAENVSA